MGLADALSPWIAPLGLLGGLGLWWATWRYGRWEPWPRRVVIAPTRAWAKGTWRQDRRAWRESTLLALALYALVMAALSGLIAL